ncbi:hypothetical protein [Selenomonas massiliensis]|uniref:hypothetical protein n=1 Tax=Selenomonas massiliensis TaxID=2058293 RepID=UPI000D10E6C3|nr:hypothetical protein [Selenomonas massiliensis]
MQRFTVGGFLLAVLVFLTSFSLCEAAEDMRFVDAEDDTGYYVDAASIVRVSDTERDAVVAVVKADENRRYLYRTRLNRQAGTYQFVSTRVEVYDTKEVLRTSQGMDVPQKYTPASPLRSIADFIEELLNEKKQPSK